MTIDKEKILSGREAVDAYRTAHAKLYDKPWYRGIPEEHTPYLRAMVNALEGLGFASTEADFEPKKTEILAKFWDASDLENIKELGFTDRDDFEKRATKQDRDKLEAMWK
jgi:hypothetical protein